jgi:hypothetical protein
LLNIIQNLIYKLLAAPTAVIKDSHKLNCVLSCIRENPVHIKKAAIRHRQRAITSIYKGAIIKLAVLKVYEINSDFAVGEELTSIFHDSFSLSGGGVALPSGWAD